jgi:putative endonuclease
MSGTRPARGRRAEQRGRLAEWLCLARLWLTGWRVLAHRLAGRRGTGLGEVDIVARRGAVLAFIEVKARGSAAAALEAVTAPQRRRIEAAAVRFLATHPAYAHCRVRFDAMIVAAGLWPRHIVDAWRPEA